MATKKSLPGSEMRAAQLIRRDGNRFMATVPGHKEPVDVKHPSVHVHIDKKTMYEHHKTGEMVNLHKAFHTDQKSIPTDLLEQILEALKEILSLQDLHAQGAGDASLGPPSPSIGTPPPIPGPMGAPPPPPMGMPPPPAGLPGSMPIAA